LFHGKLTTATNSGVTLKWHTEWDNTMWFIAETDMTIRQGVRGGASGSIDLGDSRQTDLSQLD
jgi:hypothetical protein